MASARITAAIRSVIRKLASGEELDLLRLALVETNIEELFNQGLEVEFLAAVNGQPPAKRPHDLLYRLRDLLPRLKEAATDPKLADQCQRTMDEYAEFALSDVVSAQAEDGGNWALCYLVGGFSRHGIEGERVLGEIERLIETGSFEDLSASALIDWLTALAAKPGLEAHRARIRNAAERVIERISSEQKCDSREALEQFDEEIN